MLPFPLVVCFSLALVGAFGSSTPQGFSAELVNERELGAEATEFPVQAEQATDVPARTEPPVDEVLARQHPHRDPLEDRFDSNDFGDEQAINELIREQRREFIAPETDPEMYASDAEFEEILARIAREEASALFYKTSTTTTPLPWPDSDDDDKVGDDGAEENEDNECAICFNQMKADRVYKIERCGHKFHRNCLVRWRLHRSGPGNAQQACPTCRMPYEFS